MRFFLDKIDAQPYHTDMENKLRTMLITQLERQQRDGVQRLPIDDSARAILRQWMIAARKGEIAEPSYKKSQATNPQLSQTSQNEPPTEPLPSLSGEGSSTADKLRNLYTKLPAWKREQGLDKLREQLIHGRGSLKAQILLIGDTPGSAEETANKPFAGAAGEKLDGMLKAMDLSRDKVFICYAVPFRPHSPDQAAHTRPPSTQELDACHPITLAEIEILRPKVIIALGALAARALLQDGETPLSARRNKKHSLLNIPLIVTHHPSYLLRTNDLGERRSIWEDMLTAMKIAKLPITPKQEAYFLPKSSL